MRRTHKIVYCTVFDYLLSQINDWFGAAKKTLLSNANKLLQDMQEFDKDNIPDKVIAVRRQDNNMHTKTKRVYSRENSERDKMEDLRNVAVPGDHLYV